MLCDECGKEEATFHYTKIINGVTTELHLCELCAKKKGFTLLPTAFSLADLLGGLVEREQTPSLETEISCKNCEFTYSNFKNIGLLGCSQCYSSFHKMLEPLLKKIHGASKHVGKFPKRESRTAKGEIPDVELLRKKLKDAVAREEFEEAAKLRDKIKEIEK